MGDFSSATTLPARPATGWGWQQRAAPPAGCLELRGSGKKQMGVGILSLAPKWGARDGAQERLEGVFEKSMLEFPTANSHAGSGLPLIPPTWSAWTRAFLQLASQ